MAGFALWRTHERVNEFLLSVAHCPTDETHDLSLNYDPVTPLWAILCLQNAVCCILNNSANKVF